MRAIIIATLLTGCAGADYDKELAKAARMYADALDARVEFCRAQQLKTKEERAQCVGKLVTEVERLLEQAKGLR